MIIFTDHLNLKILFSILFSSKKITIYSFSNPLNDFLIPNKISNFLFNFRERLLRKIIQSFLNNIELKYYDSLIIDKQENLISKDVLNLTEYHYKNLTTNEKLVLKDYFDNAQDYKFSYKKIYSSVIYNFVSRAKIINYFKSINITKKFKVSISNEYVNEIFSQYYLKKNKNLFFKLNYHSMLYQILILIGIFFKKSNKIEIKKKKILMTGTVWPTVNNRNKKNYFNPEFLISKNSLKKNDFFYVYEKKYFKSLRLNYLNSNLDIYNLEKLRISKHSFFKVLQKFKIMQLKRSKNLIFFYLLNHKVLKSYSYLYSLTDNFDFNFWLDNREHSFDSSLYSSHLKNNSIKTIFLPYGIWFREGPERSYFNHSFILSPGSFFINNFKKTFLKSSKIIFSGLLTIKKNTNKKKLFKRKNITIFLGSISEGYFGINKNYYNQYRMLKLLELLNKLILKNKEIVFTIKIKGNSRSFYKSLKNETIEKKFYLLEKKKLLQIVGSDSKITSYDLIIGSHRIITMSFMQSISSIWSESIYLRKKCYVFDPLPRINTYKNFDKFFSNKYIFNDLNKLIKVLQGRESNLVPKGEYRKLKNLFFLKNHNAIKTIKKIILEN